MKKCIQDIIMHVLTLCIILFIVPVSSTIPIASQWWSLASFLPLLIGDLVPEEDDCWDTFLLLHDILAHCMAPCVSPASISYLSVLIEMHHKSFSTNYPAQQMTPKMHYMVHFPELIRR